jgi:hypothetical protein
MMKEMMDANQTKTDDNQEGMDVNLKEMREEVKSGQAEMKFTVNAFQEKMDASIANRKGDREETTACQVAMETSPRKMEPNSGEQEAVVERQKIPNEEVTIHSLRACRNETAAAQEVMEADAEKTEPGPEMKPVAEHQEVSKEEASVKSSGTMKKWHRGRHLAAGRRREPEGLNRGDCGSRRKLATAQKGIPSCSSGTAKKDVFRKIGTQENCGPRKRLTVARRKMTRCATMAWCSENVIRKYWTRNQAKRGTPK